MTRRGRAGTVMVVARDRMRAARVETALHALDGWRVEVAHLRLLRRLADEQPEAILVVVLTDTESRRALRAIRALPRHPPIIALTDDAARFSMSALRGLGLRAALPLDATDEELAGAVRAVHAGLLVLHESALKMPGVRGTSVPAIAGAPLTSREREILEMMADGAHNRIIAARLGISRHTVKFHVTSILTKLGAESRTEAVALALRGGLLAV